MKFTLNNIGILKHAEIDLSKDLTILCGPNNTGKTYAAYVIYALNRLAYEGDINLLPEIKISDKMEQQLKTIGETFLDIFEIFILNEKKYTEVYCSVLTDNFYDIFDAEVGFAKNSNVSISLNHEKVRQKILSGTISRTFQHGNIYIFLNKKVNDFKVKVSLTSDQNILDESILSEQVLPNFLQEVLNDYMFANIYWKPYFAPAERIAINLFSKPILLRRNNILDVATNEYKKKRNIGHILDGIRMYSLPIRDSLQIAEQLNDYQKQKSEFNYLADEFESEILGGSVSVSEYGDVKYRPDGTNVQLGIHLSGSVVKSLFSLVFYFRHIAKKGDFIIIDEPELNLHPDNQRIVAKLLARVVNAGFKVLISTHSDYVIRELNNLIMLNKEHPDTKALREKYGYKPSEMLDYNKVGAYLFNDQHAATIEVDESGMEVSTIDEEINKLNNTANDIYWTLFED